MEKRKKWNRIILLAGVILMLCPALGLSATPSHLGVKPSQMVTLQACPD